MTRFAAATLMMLTIGCASAPEMKEADKKMVEGCTFVGHVSGNSLLGGLVQKKARQHAKEQAMRDAAKSGATHIVWTSVNSTYSGASADGDAYRCPK
jgi:hypothetical protein